MSAKPSSDRRLGVLVVWAVLCALWNGYSGVALARGGQALGPTATIFGAVLALVLAAALVVAFRNWHGAYRWLAPLPLALAAMTIWNALTLDPALWPSEFWRWAGIAVNSLGVVGAIMALLAPRRA